MDAPNLAYLFAHPTALGLSLRHPAALLLLLAVALFVMRPHRAGRLATALRSGAYAALVLALADLALTTRMPTDRLTVVAAIDTSPSIDPAGRAWAQQYLAQIQQHLGAGGRAGRPHVRRATWSCCGRPARRRRSPTSCRRCRRRRRTSARRSTAAMALLPADGAAPRPPGHRRQPDARRQRAPHPPGCAPPACASTPRSRRTRRSATSRVERVVAPSMVGVDSPVPVRVVARQRRPAAPGRPQPVSRRRHRRQQRRRAAARSQRADAASRLSQRGAVTACAPSCAPSDDAQPANNARDVGDHHARSDARPGAHRPARARRSPRALARKGVRADVRAAVRRARSRCAARPITAWCSRTSPPADLPPPTLDALERWVRERGGGLRRRRRGRDLRRHRASRDTPLKRLLPVTLEPHRPDARHRASRWRCSWSSIAPTAWATTAASARCATARSCATPRRRRWPSSDSSRTRISSASSSSTRSRTRSRRSARSARIAPGSKSCIPRLVENGGTDFYDALASRPRAAHRVARHADGTSSCSPTATPIAPRPTSTASLTAAIAADHISVTTIRIGDNTVNLKLLQDISRRPAASSTTWRTPAPARPHAARSHARARPRSDGHGVVLSRSIDDTSQLLARASTNRNCRRCPATPTRQPQARRRGAAARAAARAARPAARRLARTGSAASPRSPPARATTPRRGSAWPEFTKFWSQLGALDRARARRRRSGDRRAPRRRRYRARRARLRSDAPTRRR